MRPAVWFAPAAARPDARRDVDRRGGLALPALCALLVMLALARVAGAAPPPVSPLRAIAVAEDERRGSDGVLAGFLRAKDPAVRARAALAVGRLQDSTTVPILLPLLGDASAKVRAEAVFALGQIGHRSARAALEALLAKADSNLAFLAVEALGKLGDKAATPAVMRQLESRWPRVRGEAAMSLWRLADSTALAALVARHRETDPAIRWRVIYALEKIVMPDRVVPVVALHADDPDPTVRAYVARTLGRQKSTRANSSLFPRLSDEDPAVVVNAIRAIQMIADSTCSNCPDLLAGTLRHRDPYVRVTGATALGDRFVRVAAGTDRRARTIEAIAAHLTDTDAATRGAAARSLVNWEGEAALARVQPLLADSSLYTRVAVLQALATLPAERVTPLLMARLRAGVPLFERMTAAEVLGTMRAPRGAPVLRFGLADTSLLYVAAVAGALAELADSSSVDDLARAYAAHARDADPDARTSIRDALRTLAGTPFADSVERAHPGSPVVPPEHPAGFEQAPSQRGAVLHTTAGDIEWRFYGNEAPQTVRNFVRLAKRHYFDGLRVHRVVPNFVIQDGDPTGTGSGGPGYTIRCEYNQLRYEPGMVGMALSGKDTGGSQWFITHSPQPHLNGRYTIFARVTKGMDVVRRVVQGDRVMSVEILEK